MAKPTTVYGDTSKETTGYSVTSKGGTAFADSSKSNTTYLGGASDQIIKNYLTNENGDYLTNESGDRLTLYSLQKAISSYTAATKSNTAYQEA